MSEESLLNRVSPLAREIDAVELAHCEPLRWHEALSSRPVLNLDDVSAIPFLVGIEGVEEYQHRARLRARDGDLFAAGTEQIDSYEDYCRNRLGLGDVECIFAPAEGNPLEVARACQSGEALEKIVARTREAGGLVLHPYMGIEAVWELARIVAADSGAQVGVLAPAPPITWIANDKRSFSELVRLVLGSEYLVETLEGATAAELAGALRSLAQRHRQVALKRLRCASAMGNAVFDSASLLRMDLEAIERKARLFLKRTEWDGDEHVLAVAWEQTEISPSTQLWLPPTDSGKPRLDGIYEQLLKGTRRIFVGSRPSTLPERVNRELAEASLAVAEGLQALGYVGRCSFDFLVVGDPEGDFALRFVECNGRWGGTSTPMAFLDRLLDQPAGAQRPPYRAQDFVHADLVGATFDDVLEAVGERAFDPRTGQGCFVFYNLGPLADFGKLDVIAIADSQVEAEAALEEEFPRLLGLS